MSKRQAGSIKNKIVAGELLEERARLDFDQQELAVNCFGKELVGCLNLQYDLMRKHPRFANSHKWYEMTREEQYQDWLEKLKFIWDNMPEHRSEFFNKETYMGFHWYLVH